jgi:hypothetical protein
MRGIIMSWENILKYDHPPPDAERMRIRRELDEELNVLASLEGMRNPTPQQIEVLYFPTQEENIKQSKKIMEKIKLLQKELREYLSKNNLTPSSSEEKDLRRNWEWMN